MSWQAASLIAVTAVLVAGFGWYERSRPPSQIVAVVAALAALAVAGRVALAAIPNVVATTDIALFAGFTLGAAPGFAVGALAALVSNFWLGQGPWTPWQMAGWGMCGVAGALLARATGRRIGRVALAFWCALAGILFGALLNFSIMVSYGGEISFERFLALQSRAVPFDLAHAIGNAGLALVAGPMMIRMLIRYRSRFEWRHARSGSRGMLPRGVRPTLTVLLLAGLMLAGTAGTARSTPREALNWLAAQQNSDGGFAAEPGGDSTAEMTGWAMLGLEAGGRNPADVDRNGNSAVDFLRREIGAVSGPGDLSRTILALTGAEIDARRFAGRNLVAELRAARRPDGSYQQQVNLTAFAVMALRSVGARRGIAVSVRWLRRAQNADGGWGIVPGAPSEADSTGTALQAVGAPRTARRGVRYLARTQSRAGGWTLAGGVVNSQSTAWALQGLIAQGISPGSVRRRGRSGAAYLLAREAADGHIRYSVRTDQTDVWVTAQALVPLFGQAFPVDPVARRPRSPEGGGSGGGDGSGVSGGGGGGGSSGAGGGGGGGGVAPPSSSGSGSGATSGGVGGASQPAAPQGGGGGNAAGAGEVPDAGTPEAPAAQGAPEAEEPPPPSPAGDVDASEEVVADDADDSGPLAPLGIGLGTAMAVGFGVWWLSRLGGW